MKQVILTGDRPTGNLHIGHYAGSIKSRIELANSGKYDMYVFIADMQALTDNASNPQKIRDNVFEVAIDYLSCGLTPENCTMFIQSQIPELTEMYNYFLNLVTVSRLNRNPTVKEEIKLRGFNASIPAGFLTYPVSQAADILAFNTDLVPVGEDQLPMIEQTREIVRTFNNYYGDVLKEPEAMLPQEKTARRLPGTDGKAKMSKSLGNCIYLRDDYETLKKKVMQMYTDPNHIRIEDPGQVEGNTVFTYLDAFGKDKQKIAEMKEHYSRGGLGDVACKKYLLEVLDEFLRPIREKRAYYENHLDEVKKIFLDGSKKAQKVASETLKRMRKAIGVEYFE